MLWAPDSADWAALAAVHAAAFHGEAAASWSAAALEGAARAPGAALFARPRAEPRAFALTRIAGDEAELLTIAVAPDSRRQGHARALLGAVCAHAAAQGAAALFLEVAASNSAARALYDRFGFAQVGLRRGYHRRAGASPTDASILRLGLDRAPFNLE